MARHLDRLARPGMIPRRQGQSVCRYSKGSGHGKAEKKEIRREEENRSQEEKGGRPQEGREEKEGGGKKESRGKKEGGAQEEGCP
ncbi:MAG: hypothetical protein OSB70_02910 [Myxococcota bacterium]|nr:hypothetical protein [Myxococcota bacterium]